MRAIIFALYCLTLIAAHGGNTALNSIGQPGPSPGLKNHPDETVFICTPTPGYVLAAERREVARTANLQLPRLKTVAVGVKKELKATSLMKITPVVAITLDLRPVDE